MSLEGLFNIPLLFNVFINDIFMFIEKSEICNFADDNINDDCSEDLSNILGNLKLDIKILLTWLRKKFIYKLLQVNLNS